MALLVADLFCGMGGLVEGFRQHGFAVVGIDKNPAIGRIADTRGWQFVRLDLSTQAYGEPCDILVGGPPCRPWSGLNTSKRGDAHPDHNLLSKFLDHILALKPKAFLMENVPLVVNDISFRNLISLTKQEGYKTETRLVSYADWGAATSRRRRITVGFNAGPSGTMFFEMLDAVKKPAMTSWEAISRFVGSERGLPPDHVWPNLRTIDKYRDYYRTGKYGWCKLDCAKPAPSFGNVMKTYTLHPLAGEYGVPYRVISVKEALSIMGFPEDFSFPEGMGMGPRYQMVVDAVSPLFSAICAQIMLKIVSGPHADKDLARV